MITTQQLQLLKEGNKKLLKRCIVHTMLAFSFVLSMRRCRGGKDMDIFLQIWEKRLNIDLEGNFDGYLFDIPKYGIPLRKGANSCFKIMWINYPMNRLTNP